MAVMAGEIRKGDGVMLVETLAVIEKKDAANRTYLVAQLQWPKPKDAPDPPRLFEAIMGIYMGTEYVTVRDRRAEAGQMHILSHCFFFNSNRIYIEPRFVRRVVGFDESIG